MPRWLTLLVTLAAELLRPRRDLLLENLALRQQLTALTQRILGLAWPQQTGSSGLCCGASGNSSSQKKRGHSCLRCKLAPEIVGQTEALAIL